MARQLDLSPSTLSDVLNNKKNLSERTATEVAARLKLTAMQKKYFCTLVQFQISNDDELKALLAHQLRVLNPKMREHFEITVDRFKLMAEWYHTAILELTFLEDIEMSPVNIARVLGITSSQAREGLELLKRLDLIKEQGVDRFAKSRSQMQVQSESPNQGIRRYHYQMLAKAQESLSTQMPDEKMVGSETIPLNIDDLSEAKEIIETCFQQILQLSERSRNKNHVYHLGIQLFKLTSGIKK